MRLLLISLAAIIAVAACQRLADTADPGVQLQVYETAVTRMADELSLEHPVRLYPWLARAQEGQFHLDKYDSTTVPALRRAMNGAVEVCTLSPNGRCAGDAPYIVLAEFRELGANGVVVPMLFESPLQSGRGSAGFVRLKPGIRGWVVVQVREPVRLGSRHAR